MTVINDGRNSQARVSDHQRDAWIDRRFCLSMVERESALLCTSQDKESLLTFEQDWVAACNGRCQHDFTALIYEGDDVAEMSTVVEASHIHMYT